MAIQFAHNTQAQLDTRNLNVYINDAQILKDVNNSIPKYTYNCCKKKYKNTFFAAICYFSPIFFGSLTETLYFCGQVLFQPRSFRGEHYITNKNQ